MTDYNKLTVVKLKEELEKRGLPKSGLKAALVERLNEDDAQTAPVSTERPAEFNDQVESLQDVEPAAPTLSTNDTGVSNGTALDNAPSDGKEDGTLALEATDKGDEAWEAPIAAIEPDKMEVPAQHEDDIETSQEQPLPQSQQPEQPAKSSVEHSEQILETKGASSSLPESATTTEHIHTMRDSANITAQTSKETSVNREEVLEDSRKRKRRSLTPPPSSIDVAQKKAKADDGSPVVRLPEDLSTRETSPTPTDAEPMSGVRMTDTMVNGELHREEVGQSEEPEKIRQEEDKPERDEDKEPSQEQVMEEKENVDSNEQRDSTAHNSLQSPSKTSPTDARFKNLFSAPSKDVPAPKQDSYGDMEDREVPPALHPATSALYIRNFSRPLHPGNLKEHLASLARPPNSSPSQEPITDFFLDTIKTHCLVRFTTVSAASRVRSALHERVWPEERTRRPLWVDFAPEEKLPKWIEVEQGSGGGRGQPGKRWEVVYEQEDGKVAAYLQETDGLPSARPSISNGPRIETGMGVQGAPSGPRTADVTSQMPPTPKGDAGKGFKALDDLFRSTAAKPKLYFLPVAGSVASRRLDKLAAGRGGGRNDEKRRFSFEDDVIVDRGPEFGSGYRGGYRGRGGYSGGYPGRGGGGGYGRGYRGARGGDSWRDSR